MISSIEVLHIAATLSNQAGGGSEMGPNIHGLHGKIWENLGNVVGKSIGTSRKHHGKISETNWMGSCYGNICQLKARCGAPQFSLLIITLW